MQARAGVRRARGPPSRKYHAFAMLSSMRERSAGASLALEEVHVWLARPGALLGATAADCGSLLVADERAHVARFRFERHQREATVSRALVRSTVARYTALPVSEIRYRTGPYGRPYLDPPCGLAFNATNHPELVACAVCLASGLAQGEELGIDVEPLSRGDEILEVAKTVFSDPELERLAGLSAEERRDHAVSLWTSKEAYVKARGLGFTASLRDVVVDLATGAPPRLRFLRGYDDPEGWWLETRDVHGFRVAVALCAAGPGGGMGRRLVVREATWTDAGDRPLFSA